MKSKYEIYKNSIKENFNFLKSASNIRDAYLRAIPISSKGFLVPLCQAFADDAELIRRLTQWRNTNVEVYPTQFVASNDSTSNWIKSNLLKTHDRILFLVVSNDGTIIGHIGFNGCDNLDYVFEIDNVIRGEQKLEPGIFSEAILALMEWARKLVPVEKFILRVMEDNLKAIQFYERNDFVLERKIPLKRELNGSITTFKEVPTIQDCDKKFNLMVYKPSTKGVGKSLILTAGPSISAKESVYSYDAALNGWNSKWSYYLTKFEREFANYVGVKFALATSSCTGALQIALMALDIGPGDEVIVPDETWVATANAVRYVGAIPVFADVELDTWNLDVGSVEGLITNKTKAIIPVHMYGHPARMDKLIQLSKKYGLKIVEDAAPAIGAEWNGKRCGSFGDFAAFSFQGAKLMVTGEGGMLVTNDEKLYEKALKIWDQGRNPSKTFWIDGNGVKFKMSNIQAALGLAQLERVDELIEMKRRVFSWYEEDLELCPFISLNKEVDGARSIYWMSSLRLEEGAPISRDDLIRRLKEVNVDTRPVFPAISQYPIWPRQQAPQPIAMRIGLQALNLPSGVCLSKDEVFYASKQIRKILSA